MTFFSGWIQNKFGEKKAISFSALFQGCYTVPGAFIRRMAQCDVILQPALIACYFPPGFAALYALYSLITGACNHG
jgi:hypothetical protein